MGEASKIDLTDYRSGDATMAMKDPVHPGRIVRGAIADLEVSVTGAALR
jgi:hypothetical protein